MRERILGHPLWRIIILLAGIANIVAFLPQLHIIYVERKAEGVSIGMFALFIYIQLCFAGQGYLTRSWVQVVSMFASALMSTAIIIGTLLYR